MKRLFCLVLFFILIFSVVAVCASCATATQEKTCECPYQLKTFTGHINYSAECTNKWLQENPQFEIVNVQYAFGTSRTGTGDTTYGLIITYIQHTCE
jgi:ABC-type glycerol-3-phosphate transport system substrate-binding protein